MGPLTLITVALVGLGVAQWLRFVKASKAARTAGWSLILIVVFWVWYMVAADYGYGAVSGTYTLRSEGDSSTLVLQRDRSFQQELSQAGKNVRSKGTWRRSGESSIDFSKEFLPLGQEVLPGGHVYAEVRKGFAGIFVSAIEFGPEGKGPVFYRGWLR